MSRSTDIGFKSLLQLTGWVDVIPFGRPLDTAKYSLGAFLLSCFYVPPYTVVLSL